MISHSFKFVAALATLAIACGDTPPQATSRSAADPRAGAANQSASRPSPSSSTARDGGAQDPDASGPPLHGRVLQDIDFTESDRSRDPFRSFARDWVPRNQAATPLPTDNIKLANLSLDDMRVIAIVVGVSNPYAMVVDSDGAGTIIRRGDLVGRPDTIVSAGENGGPHQVPWRVARIVGSRISRDRNNNLVEIPAEVVFEREDRASLNPTRIERSLTLAPPGEGRGGPAAASSAATAPALPTLPALPGGSPFLPPNPASLPPGSRTTATQSQQGSTLVQSYTTVIPPTQPQPAAQPQPTTVVVQAPPAQPAQQGPQPAPLPDTPPPVRITGSAPFPSAGLAR
jgi:type IV pilus assembly protein PilP